MSTVGNTGAKKVTKIIRKDGITYRPAGGVQHPVTTEELVKKPDQSTIQGKKKSLGKVIKRADGTTIVVVDGKIVKTMKPKNSLASPSKVTAKSQPQNAPKVRQKISPPLTDISADELTPEKSEPSFINFKDNHDFRNTLELKRTITFDKNTRTEKEQGSEPLLKNPSPNIHRSTKPLLTREFNVVNSRPDHKHISPSQRCDSYKSQTSEKERDVSRNESRQRRDYSTSGRSGSMEAALHSHKKVRRSRSPRRARSPHASRPSTRSRLSEKALSSKQSRTRSKSKSPKTRNNDKQSNSPKASRSASRAKTYPIAQSSLTSLLTQETTLSSKEDILNLIQKQAEEMLQAQHSGPIDDEKKKKLREAMESILIKRGLIDSTKTKKRKQSLLRSISSDSSDGRESPPILEKLRQKYNKSTEVSEKNQLDMEAISPCIDNISVASNDQKISDVTHSDMEMSDEEAKNDDEDGKTPAFRKKIDITENLVQEPSPQLIQIKLGKDADEEAFQELASGLDRLKTSSDVQNLIEAIENKIKSFLTINLDPSTLEKKIRRYQTLVAKVVIQAESIKEKEEDDKVTYHRYSKTKERKSAERRHEKSVEPPISYPVQSQEQKKPWLYPTQSPGSSGQYLVEDGTRIPLQPDLVEDNPPDPYEKVKAQYISQKVGYHVCLLCMIESSNESQFQRHLDGKKHIEAVHAKVKQITTPTNIKKFKKHSLVIKCKLCDVICNGQKKYNDHANHRSHQALIQAYVKIGRVVPEPEILHDHEDQIREQIVEIQESGTPAVGREFMSVKTVHDCDDNIVDVYYCSLCKANCNSEIQVERHVRSKKHYLIYVKVAQPDVNIQVNAAEHKKRRETTKKIVSTMRTIKQMEEVIERNREKLNQDSFPTTNLADQKQSEHPYNVVKKASNSSNFSSFLASDPPEGFQLGPGRTPMTHPLNHNANSASSAAPYYRDPTIRLSSGIDMPSQLPRQSNVQSFSNPRSSFSPGPNPVPVNRSNLSEQNECTMSESRSHKEPYYEKYDKPNQLKPQQEAKSAYKALQDFSNSYTESNRQPFQSHRPRFGQSDSGRSGSFGSSPFPSAPFAALSQTEGPFMYNPAGSESQSNDRFVGHQKYASALYKNYSTSDSNKSVSNIQPHASDPSCRAEDPDDYGSKADQSSYRDEYRTRSGMSSTGDQSYKEPPPSGSYNTASDHEYENSQQQSQGYQSREISWPNRPMINVKPKFDSFPSSPAIYQGDGNNSSATSHAYSDPSRSTYRSAYNLLNKSEEHPSSSFAGPTYSGKPTYSGVYTNAERG